MTRSIYHIHGLYGGACLLRYVHRSVSVMASSGVTRMITHSHTRPNTDSPLTARPLLPFSLGSELQVRSSHIQISGPLLHARCNVVDGHHPFPPSPLPAKATGRHG